MKNALKYRDAVSKYEMIILKQTKAASNQSVKLEGAIFGSVKKIIFF